MVILQFYTKSAGFSVSLYPKPLTSSTCNPKSQPHTVLKQLRSVVGPDPGACFQGLVFITPKVGTKMAQNPLNIAQNAIILHTLGVRASGLVSRL